MILNPSRNPLINHGTENDDDELMENAEDDEGIPTDLDMSTGTGTGTGTNTDEIRKQPQSQPRLASEGGAEVGMGAESTQSGPREKERGDGDEDTNMMDKTETTNKVDQDEDEDTRKLLRELDRILNRTRIISGFLVCGNCGHEYAIREGVCNFLVPAHLV